MADEPKPKSKSKRTRTTTRILLGVTALAGVAFLVSVGLVLYLGDRAERGDVSAGLPLIHTQHRRPFKRVPTVTRLLTLE